MTKRKKVQEFLPIVANSQVFGYALCKNNNKSGFNDSLWRHLHTNRTTDRIQHWKQKMLY
jgi:hypothetical protein